MGNLAGRTRQYVSLARTPQTSPDSDGFWEALSPPDVWCAIQPLPAGSGDGRSTFHLVTMRYHPQVTMDTRITFGTRELFVRNVQNVDERNRELRLYCEEVVP